MKELTLQSYNIKSANMVLQQRAEWLSLKGTHDSLTIAAKLALAAARQISHYLAQYSPEKDALALSVEGGLLRLHFVRNGLVNIRFRSSSDDKLFNFYLAASGISRLKDWLTKASSSGMGCGPTVPAPVFGL